LFFAIHAVHPQEHLGPVLALGATGAGVDLHNAGEFVFGLVERALEFRLFDLCNGLLIGFACFFLAGFAGFPEIEKDGEIFDGSVDGVVELRPIFVELDILENFGRPLVVVPEARA
jgi:hypothetical protein